MSSTHELGALVLRISLGIMFIAHSLLKIFVFTLPGTVKFFEMVGLPGFIAYIVVFAELAAGIALLAGFKTRLVALASLPILLGAVWVHFPNGWVFSAPNGGWEYAAFLVIAVIVQALIGSGAYAIDNKLRSA